MCDITKRKQSDLNTARVQIIKPASGMPVRIKQIWRDIQAQNPTLNSPYFAPEFTQIVASYRPRTEVAMVETTGDVVALFPFERSVGNFAAPVGSFLSDYQGVISNPDFVFDPHQLLQACSLVAWDFNHVLQSQTCFSPFHQLTNRSPIIDLAQGYEAYVKGRRDAGTEQIKKNANLARRLEREIGPLRFIAHSPDTQLLRKLLAWKTEQFRRNRWRDIFSIPWVRYTMEEIHAAQTPNFAGMLSLLYAGDQLVAAHFGMRSATVWHYWFPSYDPAFSKYSPGVILLLKMAEASPAMGIGVIDLGCGEHSYKSRLMNNSILTAKGSVELPCLATTARRILEPIRLAPFRAHCWLSKTPVGALARQLRRNIQL